MYLDIEEAEGALPYIFVLANDIIQVLHRTIGESPPTRSTRRGRQILAWPLGLHRFPQIL